MQLETDVPIDDIREPSRDDKLHPYEREDEESFEDLCDSIGDGDGLQKPLEAVRRDGHYELIDGDRRLRALKENDVESVPYVLVRDEDDVPTQADKLLLMMGANENREPSDKYQKARQTAKLVAPWLLPPSDRGDETFSQSEVAERLGKSQPTISRWLEPIRDEYPLRFVLGEISGNERPSDDPEELQKIDRIVDLLRFGGEDGNLVVPSQQTGWCADELADMEGVSLGEIKTSAEKAVENDWGMNEFLEFVEENFAHDPEDRVSAEIQSGMLDGSDPINDGSADRSRDDVPEGEPAKDDESTTGSFGSEDEAESEEDGDPFGDVEIDVNWSEHVSDDQLPEDKSVAEVTNEQIGVMSAEDEVFEALSLVAEAEGIDRDEVLNKVFGPAIVEETIAHFQTEEVVAQ